MELVLDRVEEYMKHPVGMAYIAVEKLQHCSPEAVQKIVLEAHTVPARIAPVLVAVVDIDAKNDYN